MASDTHGSSQWLFSPIKTHRIVNTERVAWRAKARTPMPEGANPADFPVEFAANAANLELIVNLRPRKHMAWSFRPVCRPALTKWSNGTYRAI